MNGKSHSTCGVVPWADGKGGSVISISFHLPLSLAGSNVTSCHNFPRNAWHPGSTIPSLGYSVMYSVVARRNVANARSYLLGER